METRPIDFWFLLVGLLADIAGILTWAGVGLNRDVGLAAVGALAVLGILVSAVPLGAALRLAWSPKGRLFPWSFHLRRLVMASTVLVAAGGLAVAVIVGLANDDRKGSSRPAKTQAGDGHASASPAGVVDGRPVRTSASAAGRARCQARV